MEDDATLVRFDNVTKAFGGVKALDGVSFSLRPGEVHALLGQNGAGKSTLIKILAGVTSMDDGTVTINGRHAQFRTPAAARDAGIAVVYQELSLVPALSVAANVHLGREPRLGPGLVRKRQLAEETRAFLERYGFPLSVDERVENLPFAYRQLTEIAKALSGNVSVLVLDEPTSALSEGEEQILFDAIERVTNHGVGVIYVTHRLNEVFRISQRVTVLRDGRDVGTFATADIDLASLVETIVGRSRAEALREVTTAGLGPHGEQPAAPDQLSLDDDAAALKARDLKIGVLLHTREGDWARGQIRGLTETLSTYGVSTTEVLDTYFDAERQLATLNTMIDARPDAIVSLPLDSPRAGTSYAAVSRAGVELILIDNVPAGLQAGEDYACLVSADNYAAGGLAAQMLSPFIESGSPVGVVGYHPGFFPTAQRELGFRRWLQVNRPDVEVVRDEFGDPSEAQSCADRLLSQHPAVESVFAVWDAPAMAVVAAARRLGRTLAITTVDLGREVALELATGELVKGVAAQQPHAQGAAEGMAVLNALLHRPVPPWVAVPPMPVGRDNLQEAYRLIWKDEPPPEVVQALLTSPRCQAEPASPRGGVPTGHPSQRPARPALLELRQVTNDRLHGVDLVVRPGEILGLAGMVGSGRTEILETAFGLRGVKTGSVLCNGKPVALRHPYQAIQRGIALVPEDRHLEGVALDQSIGRNLVLPRLPQLSRLGCFRRSAAQGRIRSVMSELSIKAPGPDTLVRNLSGGNQQKVVFGKWRSPDPIVLLLDEPTVGVDVGARDEIYSIVRDLAAHGTGVVVVSSELAELLLLCDRIAIVTAGRVTNELPRSEVESEQHLHRLVQESLQQLGQGV